MTETTTTRFATYLGAGEFYSNIVRGEQVTVVGPDYLGSCRIQSAENPGAWLHLYDTSDLVFADNLPDFDHFEDIGEDYAWFEVDADPTDLTFEDWLA